MPPLISVIMPVYNTEIYLVQAVDSVLHQTFRDFELVIVDDGSTDGSTKILQDYALRYPDVIRLFRQTNQGAYSAVNRCIQEAKGKYIQLLNSDDYLVEDCLEIVSSYAVRFDVDAVLVNMQVDVVDADRNTLRSGIMANGMQNEIVLLDQPSVRNRWLDIVNLGLVRANTNSYKAELMKGHPFRTDYYGADFLFNIEIASEITRVASHPKNLYRAFIYQDSRDMGRNVSVGKYYAYEHAMFNEFYHNYKALFSSWNLLDHNHLAALAHLRVGSLDNELVNISAWNNTMPSWERIDALVSYVDDVLLEAAAFLGKRNEVEDKILSTCWSQMTEASQTDRQTDRQEHCVVRLMKAYKDTRLSVALRMERMLDALFHESNPYHVGLYAYQSFCAQYPASADEEALAYLTMLESARSHILTGEHILAVEELVKLFEMPFMEPERYLLLGINCRALGAEEDANAALMLGLEQFPGHLRLQRALEGII